MRQTGQRQNLPRHAACGPSAWVAVLYAVAAGCAVQVLPRADTEPGYRPAGFVGNGADPVPEGSPKVTTRLAPVAAAPVQPTTAAAARK